MTAVTARRNNLVLPDHRLAILAPCKTASTSVMTSLAQALGWTTKRLRDLAAQGAWTPQWIAENCRDYLIVGLCRHPYERFASAYADQIVRRRRWGRLGFDAAPTLLETAKAVFDIGDVEIDEHWRSMVADLAADGVSLSQRLVRHEHIGQDWLELAAEIKTRCNLDMPSNLVTRNVSGNNNPLDDECRALIARRYADDFDLFGYMP